MSFIIIYFSSLKSHGYMLIMKRNTSKYYDLMRNDWILYIEIKIDSCGVDNMVWDHEIDYRREQED